MKKLITVLLSTLLVLTSTITAHVIVADDDGSHYVTGYLEGDDANISLDYNSTSKEVTISFLDDSFDEFLALDEEEMVFVFFKNLSDYSLDITPKPRAFYTSHVSKANQDGVIYTGSSEWEDEDLVITYDSTNKKIIISWPSYDFYTNDGLADTKKITFECYSNFDSVYDSAVLKFANIEIPMVCRSIDSTTGFWDIDYEHVQWKTIDPMINTLRDNFVNFATTITVKKSDSSEKTFSLNSSNVSYGEKNEQLLYYFTDPISGEDFYLYSKGAYFNIPSPQAYIEVNNSNYSFVLDQGKSNVNEKFYVINLPEGITLDNIPHDGNIVLTDEQGGTHYLWYNLDDNRWVNNELSIVGSSYFFGDLSTEKVIYLVFKYEGNNDNDNDNSKDSLISIYGDQDYDCYKQGNDGYFWNIYVDPAQLYATNNGEFYYYVGFENNGKYSFIEFEETEDTDRYRIKQTLIDRQDGPETVELELKKWEDLRIDVKAKNTKDGEVAKVEHHQFGLNSRNDEILKHTFVKSISNINDMHFDSLDAIVNGYFNNPMAIVFPRYNDSKLIDDLNSIDLTKSYLNGEYENSYYNIQFDDDVTLVDKKYSFITYEQTKIPAVSYTLKKDDRTENFVVGLSIQESQSYGGEINIDGDRYHKISLYRNGELFTLYRNDSISNNIATEIFDATNCQYPTIVINVSNDFIDRNKQENIERFYLDGVEYTMNAESSFEVYAPDDTVNFENNITYNDLAKFKLDSLNSNVIYRTNLNTLSYSEAKRQYDEMQDYLVQFNKNNSRVNAKVFDDKEEFSKYNGSDPAVYYDLEKVSDKYAVTISYNFRSLTSIYRFDNHGESIEMTDRDVSCEVSNQEQLLAAVNNYSTVYNGTIKFKNDITINDDIYLFHGYIDIGEQNSDKCLHIDLNGHNLNVSNHSLIIPKDSHIDICNSQCHAEDESTKEEKHTISTITGYGNQIILAYGSNVVVNDGVEIENTNTSESSVVKVNNINNYFRLSNNAKLTGYTGIKFIEHSFLETSRPINADIFGTIEATYSCIDIDLPSAGKSLNDRISINANLDSLNYGILSNGYITYSVDNTNLVAKNPFVINGGKIEIRDSNINNTDSNLSNSFTEGNAFEKASPNGTLILVDSKDINSNDVSIQIDAGGENKFKSCGPIVADTSIASTSKVTKLNFYSGNVTSVNQYFDYASNLLTYNINTDNITISGGNFSIKSNDDQGNSINSEVKAYAELSGCTAMVRGYMYDGNGHYYDDEYYCLIKGKNRETVTNKNDLINALNSTSITHVIVADSIDLEGATISANVSNNMKRFEFYGTDSCIKNGSININGDIVNENARFDVYDGNFENVTLVNIGAKTRIENTIINNTNKVAILLKSGSFDIQNNSSVSGTSALVIDEEIKDNNYSSFYINDSSVIGLTDSAIRIVKSNYEINKNYGNINTWNGETIVETKASNKPVIYIGDYYSIHCDEGRIVGGNYGVQFSDDIDIKGKDSQDGYQYMPFFSLDYRGVIESKNGAYVADYCSFQGKGTITAEDNVVDTKQLSQINIDNGYYFSNNKILNYVGNYDITLQFSYQWFSGGYYSMMVDERGWRGHEDKGYKYVCLQLEDIDASTYPFAIVKQKGNNSQNVCLSYKKDIIVDESALDDVVSDEEKKAIESSGKSLDVVITVKDEKNKELKDQYKGRGCKEYYDIHVNKNVGDEISRIDEVDDYQIVYISLAEVTGRDDLKYDDVTKVVVYHQHENNDNVNPVPMKKVSEIDGLKKKEECYFLCTKDGKNFVGIVTRRFSLFAIGEAQEAVSTSDLKQNVSLTLGYEDSYNYGDTIATPQYATYGDSNQIESNKVKIKYYSSDNGVYYSENETPSEIGSYTAEWIINEGEDITGSGKKNFSIVSVHNHVYDQEVVDDDYLVSEATCTDKAVYYKSCECGEVGTDTFEFGSALGHSFATEWTKDEDYHWHAATCTHTTEKSGYAAHSWNNGSVTVSPTHTSEGEKLYICTVCDQTKTESIAKLTAHTFNKEVVDSKYKASDATCTEPAKYYKSCECGEKGAETFNYGSATGHSFSSEWTKNENYHWHAATCAHTSEKRNYEEHTWNEGVITLDSTHLKTGTKLFTCTKCGQTKTETIAKISIHTFNKEVVDNKYLVSEASCAEPAKYYKSCECGEAGSETFTNGSALGHHIIKVETKIEGNSIIAEHYMCDRCNKLYSDINGNNEVTITDLTHSKREAQSSISDISTKSKEEVVSSITEIVNEISPEGFSDVIADDIRDNGTSGIYSTLVDAESKLDNSVSTAIDDTLKAEFTGSINIVGAKFNSDEDLSFNIGLNESNEIKQNLPEIYNPNKSLTFSLNLTVNGSEIGLKIPVIIELPIPSTLDINRINLFHNHDGENELVDIEKYSIQGINYIRFITTSFSDFMLIETKDPENGGNHYIVPNTGIKVKLY